MKKLGSKILVLIISVSLVSLGALLLLNFATYNSEFAKLQQDVKNAAQGAAEVINADALQKAITEGTMDSQEYKDVQQALVQYKNDIDVKYLYTMYAQDGKLYFAVDSSLIEPSEMGEEYDKNLPAIQNAFKGQADFTADHYTDSYGTFLSGFAPIKNSSGDVVAIVGADKDVATFVHIQDKINLSILWAAAIIIVLSALASMLFSRGITANVGKIREALDKMSQGDLTSKLSVKGRDEFHTISDIINSFGNQFRGSIKNVRETTESVMEYSENLSALSQEMAATSKQVSLAVENVAASTTEQAEEFDNINRIIEGFGEKIGDVTKAMADVDEKVGAINTMARDSSVTLGSLEQSLNDVMSSFSQVSNKIDALNAQLAKINEITDMINGIADQTNMIALNASIEAARAGESGRGFAVVANEIRGLAEQSKTSSANISSLLNGISNESAEVTQISGNMSQRLSGEIDSIRKSVESFKVMINALEDMLPGISAVNKNIYAIDEEKDNIVSSISSVTQKSEQISAAAEEISASSQDSSHSSQEVAEGAQNLIEKAQVMVDSIHIFKVD